MAPRALAPVADEASEPEQVRASATRRPECSETLRSSLRPQAKVRDVPHVRILNAKRTRASARALIRWVRGARKIARRASRTV
jgi:hypothetical protein